MIKKISVFVFLLVLFNSAHAQSIAKWKITDLEAYIQKSKNPLIVNFWATFCKPCIEELPYFHEAIKQYKKKGVKLLLVSLDIADLYPEKISQFARKYNYTAPIVWLDETDADYFCPKVDNAWSGALPASLFINNKTGYRRFYENQVPKEMLMKELKAMIIIRNEK